MYSKTAESPEESEIDKWRGDESPLGNITGTILNFSFLSSATALLTVEKLSRTYCNHIEIDKLGVKEDGKG